MSLPQKLKHEIKALAFAALFFGAWIGALLALKSVVRRHLGTGGLPRLFLSPLLEAPWVKQAPWPGNELKQLPKQTEECS